MEKNSLLLNKNIELDNVSQKILDLYNDLLAHDGYGELKIEVKILKRGQKEIIIHCGRQYRFVVDFQNKMGKDIK